MWGNGKAKKKNCLEQKKIAGYFKLFYWAFIFEETEPLFISNYKNFQ